MVSPASALVKNNHNHHEAYVVVSTNITIVGKFSIMSRIQDSTQRKTKPNKLFIQPEKKIENKTERKKGIDKLYKSGGQKKYRCLGYLPCIVAG